MDWAKRKGPVRIGQVPYRSILSPAVSQAVKTNDATPLVTRSNLNGDLLFEIALQILTGSAKSTSATTVLPFLRHWAWTAPTIAANLSTTPSESLNGPARKSERPPDGSVSDFGTDTPFWGRIHKSLASPISPANGKFSRSREETTIIFTIFLFFCSVSP